MTPADLDPRISSLVVARGLLDATRLDRVRAFVESRGGSLIDALRALRLLPDAVLLGVMQEVTGIEALDPALISIEPGFQSSMDELWPAALATLTQTIPIRFVGIALQVAMAEPWNEATRTAIEAFTGCPVLPALMLHDRADVPEPASIAEAIAEGWRQRSAVPLATTVSSAAERVSRREAARSSLEDLARSAEITRAVQAVFCRAASAGASDVHLDPTPAGLRIRFRVDGRLRDAAQALPALLPAVMARLRLLCGLTVDPASGRLLDGAFTCAVAPDRRVEVRISIVRALAGERCTLRLVDRDSQLPTLADLGMDAATRDIAMRAAAEPHGLVLVCGPTGSGKTSTLYSLLSQRASEDVAIVTAEDPVERELTGVVQVPCNEPGGPRFADVLRALLRQDPDVIMVGEIRDPEAAALAVRAASTGHLVLTSLHAGSAAATVDRAIGLGVDPQSLTTILRAVIAQRLIRRLCDSCRRPVEIDPREWRQAGGAGDGAIAAFGPTGCPACAGTGYRGRVGIFEVLRVSPRLRAQILAGATAEVIERTARGDGMTTLREAGLGLVAAGETSMAEVIGLTRDEEA